MTDKAIEAAHDIFFEMIDAGKSSMECMRSAIEAYEQAMWRPIDDEAKTGKKFLILEDGKYAFIATWWKCYSLFYRDEVYGFWTSSDPSRAHVILPEYATHYRPLPPTPGKEG